MLVDKIIENNIKYHNLNITKEEILSELSTSIDKLDILYNIDWLPDLDKSSKLIKKHMDNNNHIAIVTDYDSDGINSAVILTKCFQDIFNYNNITTIINKRKNGNGFNNILVNEILDIHNSNKIDLIITADHGSSDKNVFNKFKKLGIDIIVTDHHQIPEDDFLDNVDAFINNQYGISKNTIYQELCGSGIAFVTMLHLYTYIYGKLDISKFYHIIPYVMIATITDVMSMNNIFNRVIINTGLLIFNSFKNPVWKVICNKLELFHNITAKDIGYSIGPFINSANRVGVEELAFNLLMAKDVESATIYTDELLLHNNNRKIEQNRLLNEIDKQIEMSTTNYSLVIIIKTTLGINGIISSMIGEKYKLPTVCFIDNDNDELIGSCRSILEYVNIIDILNYIKKTDPDIIIKSGGHNNAAGLTIRKDKLDIFTKLFDIGCKIQIENNNNVNNYTPIVVSIKDITPQLVYDKNMLAPYGKDWKEPIFMVTGILISCIPINNGLRITIGNKKNSISMLYFYNNEDGITANNYDKLLIHNTLITVTFVADIISYKVPIFRLTIKNIIKDI